MQLSRSGVLHVHLLKYPASGVQLSFILFPGLTNALSGHCEPWATTEKPLSGVLFQTRTVSLQYLLALLHKSKLNLSSRSVCECMDLFDLMDQIDKTRFVDLVY